MGIFDRFRRKPCECDEDACVRMIAPDGKATAAWCSNVGLWHVSATFDDGTVAERQGRSLGDDATGLLAAISDLAALDGAPEGIRALARALAEIEDEVLT